MDGFVHFFTGGGGGGGGGGPLDALNPEEIAKKIASQITDSFKGLFNDFKRDILSPVESGLNSLGDKIRDKFQPLLDATDDLRGFADEMRDLALHSVKEIENIPHFIELLKEHLDSTFGVWFTMLGNNLGGMFTNSFKSFGCLLEVLFYDWLIIGIFYNIIFYTLTWLFKDGFTKICLLYWLFYIVGHGFYWLLYGFFCIFGGPSTADVVMGFIFQLFELIDCFWLKMYDVFYLTTFPDNVIDDCFTPPDLYYLGYLNFKPCSWSMDFFGNQIGLSFQKYEAMPHTNVTDLKNRLNCGDATNNPAFR